MRPETFMLVAGVALLAIVLAFTNHKKDAVQIAELQPLPSANVRYQPYVFLDQVTGCEYLSTHTVNGLVARIAADGKTHMGCKTKNVPINGKSDE
jgi:hypothetical protein